MPALYSVMPDIREHFPPTFPTTTVPLADPPSSSTTIWLSSPTPDAADAIARSSVPDGFTLDGLEAIDLTPADSISTNQGQDPVMVWVYTAVSVGAAALVIIIVYKVTRAYMRRRWGEPDPEKAVEDSASTDKADGATVQIVVKAPQCPPGVGPPPHATQCGRVRAPVRLGGQPIVICTMSDALTPGHDGSNSSMDTSATITNVSIVLSVHTEKTAETSSATIEEVKDEVGQVEQDVSHQDGQLDAATAKAMTIPLPTQLREEVEDLSQDVDVMPAVNAVLPLQTSEEAEDLARDVDLVIALNMPLPHQAKKEVEDIARDVDLVSALNMKLPFQSDDEVQSLILDVDAVLAINTALPIQSSKEEEDLAHDVDLVLALNMALPTQTKSEAEDIARDADLVMALNMTLPLQSNDEAKNLSIDIDLYMAVNMHLPTQTGEEVKSLKLDVDIMVAICVKLPVLRSDEEVWLAGLVDDGEVVKSAVVVYENVEEQEEIGNDSNLNVPDDVQSAHLAETEAVGRTINKRGRSTTILQAIGVRCFSGLHALSAATPKVKDEIVVHASASPVNSQVRKASTLDGIVEEDEEEEEDTKVSTNVLENIFSMLANEGFAPKGSTMNGDNDISIDVRAKLPPSVKPARRIAGMRIPSPPGSPRKNLERAGRLVLGSITNVGKYRLSSVGENVESDEENQNQSENTKNVNISGQSQTVDVVKARGRRGRGMTVCGDAPIVSLRKPIVEVGSGHSQTVEPDVVKTRGRRGRGMTVCGDLPSVSLPKPIVEVGIGHSQTADPDVVKARGRRGRGMTVCGDAPIVSLPKPIVEVGSSAPSDSSNLQLKKENYTRGRRMTMCGYAPPSTSTSRRTIDDETVIQFVSANDQDLTASVLESIVEAVDEEEAEPQDPAEDVGSLDTFLGDLAKSINVVSDDCQQALVDKLAQHLRSLSATGSFEPLQITEEAQQYQPEPDIEESYERPPNTTMMYLDTRPSIGYDPNRDYWEPDLHEPAHHTLAPSRSCLRSRSPSRERLAGVDGQEQEKKKRGVYIAGYEAITIEKDLFHPPGAVYEARRKSEAMAMDENPITVIEDLGREIKSEAKESNTTIDEGTVKPATDSEDVCALDDNATRMPPGIIVPQVFPFFDDDLPTPRHIPYEEISGKRPPSRPSAPKRSRSWFLKQLMQELLTKLQPKQPAQESSPASPCGSIQPKPIIITTAPDIPFPTYLVDAKEKNRFDIRDAASCSPNSECSGSSSSSSSELPSPGLKGRKRFSASVPAFKVFARGSTMADNSRSSRSGTQDTKENAGRRLFSSMMNLPQQQSSLTTSKRRPRRQK